LTPGNGSTQNGFINSTSHVTDTTVPLHPSNNLQGTISSGSQPPALHASDSTGVGGFRVNTQGDNFVGGFSKDKYGGVDGSYPASQSGINLQREEYSMGSGTSLGSF